MKKQQLGAISLLAGSAIGSGMISLPLVLANFGIIFSFAIIAFFSWLTYISAIIRCDLNIHSDASFSLKDVGLIFGGKIAGFIGDFSIKLLSFSLLSAYIFGGASIINSFLGNCFNETLIIVLFSTIIILMLSFHSNLILMINNYVFVLKICIFIFFVMYLIFQANVEIIPINFEGIKKASAWSTLVPIVFTSFGFQGSLHTMTKLVNNDRKMIKKVCLLGSLIPAIVYAIWTTAILLIAFNIDKNFFNKMVEGSVSIGELIKILSSVSSEKTIQLTVWSVSILAIITSIIGVGLSLIDILKKEFEKISSNKRIRKILAILSAIILPTFIAIFVPNAFIKVLNFSGIILSIIAIIMPVFLFSKLMKKTDELLLKNKTLKNFVFVCGIAIILFGICDIFY